MKQLLVIEGPTASGKTALSVQLAQHFGCSIVSADSRQFYRELAIGTAKPTREEMQGIPHFFIDSHSLSDEVSSARYAAEALPILDELFQENDTVIMAGGSGLFIDAVCIGLDPIPGSETIKKELIEAHKKLGLAPLLEELRHSDPTYYERVDRKNPARIIRALEAIRVSGKTYTEQRENTVNKHPYAIRRFVINHPRESLYARINQRVEEMMAKGLLDEVKKVESMRHLRSLNTVGYSELFDYLDGKCSLTEAVAAIQQNTRRYAKRQLTWFRRHPDAYWLKSNEINTMKDEIIQQLNTQPSQGTS